ncbi:hypothetical protein D3C72_1477370 [compost metagenome]
MQTGDRDQVADAGAPEQLPVVRVDAALVANDQRDQHRTEARIGRQCRAQVIAHGGAPGFYLPRQPLS